MEWVLGYEGVPSNKKVDQLVKLAVTKWRCVVNSYEQDSWIDGKSNRIAQESEHSAYAYMLSPSHRPMYRDALQGSTQN
ncbi:hypothetical protein DPV78_007714 [Talaromyces pinophilus]|nr:hypothetical protein DPV78_007714 [Talaromyces pinophilus]